MLIRLTQLDGKLPNFRFNRMLQKIQKWFLIANGVALGLIVLAAYAEFWIHAPWAAAVTTYVLLLMVCTATYGEL